jgi:cell division protein FtsN
MVLPFYLFAFTPLCAQTFTERLQKPVAGQGTVTINQNDSINELVNTTVLQNRPAQPVTTTATPSSTQTQRRTDNHATTHNGQTTENHAVETADDEQPHTPTTMAKVTGYRVQVYAGYNREGKQTAERTRSSLKSHFPNVPVYVNYFNPRWVCRMGNYRTYEEAHQMLVTLQNLGYNQCTIVKGKITVAY